MDARSFTLGNLFNQGGGIQYVVPYFQRQYTWAEEDWQILLDDVLLLCSETSNDDSTEHFMGSLVIVSSECAGAAPRYTLIDGQQRLITLSLLLKSLGVVGHEDLGEKQAYVEPMLTNTLEKGPNVLKVLPSEKNEDREAYWSLMGSGGIPSEKSRIPTAYRFFVGKLQGLKRDTQADFQRMFDIITKHLTFIRIETVPAEKPYRIFESLNGRGKRLTQGDLIRNYVAMRLPDPDDQDEVFKGSWGTIDNLLDETREVGKSGLHELTAFIRLYLATISGALYDERNVYQEFRNHAERQARDTQGFKALINRMARYAVYYDRLLRPRHEPQDETSSLLSSLELFDQSASYPFLLEAYEAMEQRTISRQQFDDMLRQLEGYFVRRFLCNNPSSYPTKQLPQVWAEVSGTSDPVSALGTSLGKRKCPTDKEVAEELIHVRLYQTARATPRVSHILLKVSCQVGAGIDAHPVVSSTIEHVMPQTLSPEWRAQLGPEAEEIKATYGDTLANLTLVPQGWNSQLSNKPFAEKKVKLIESKLPVNYMYFANVGDSWGVEQIKERGEWLGKLLGTIYPEFPRTMEPPATAGSSPRSLRLDGNLLLVGSWRDVTHQTLLYIVERGMFERVRSEIPAAFQREGNQPSWPFRWRKLPNGWRVDAGLSGLGTVRFCGRAMAAAGLASVEWKPSFDDLASE